MPRVARFRHGKYGRFKENGNFYAKWHRTYSKMICRNTGDHVKYGRSCNPSYAWWKVNDSILEEISKTFNLRQVYLLDIWITSWLNEENVSSQKFVWGHVCQLFFFPLTSGRQCVLLVTVTIDILRWNAVRSELSCFWSICLISMSNWVYVLTCTF